MGNAPSPIPAGFEPSAPCLPPAADEVEAVKQAILAKIPDVHGLISQGHYRLAAGQLAQAAVQSRSAKPVQDRHELDQVMETADRLARRMGGRFVPHSDHIGDANGMVLAEPAGEEPVSQELEDALNDILSPFHWEAWKAALFSDHEEGWPDDDEQEAIVRRVDSVAVGEHYQAWAEEVRAKLIAALAAEHAERIEHPTAADWRNRAERAEAECKELRAAQEKCQKEVS
ncbi:hypothetical protein EDF59_1024 [Novosphingobium sp. ST904]|nr:hypothetical protein EDF59_1024 [Novosphingobium sp. ST904]